MNSLFDRITIIGLGLIGSSIARGIKKHHVADIVVGCDTNPETLNIARAQKIVDIATPDPRIAVTESQLVIICTPPAIMDVVAKDMAPGLAEGALVMDTASMKLFPIKVISQHLPLNVFFVPAHPIAGGEQSGISAGRADLLHKKQVIVTPSEPLSGDLLRKVTSFWNFLGARVEGMPPDIHDYLYAHISHLPQLLSFATKEIVQSTPNDEIMMRFTRLQKSNRKLWTEIFLLNSGPVLGAVDRYLDVMTHIKSELMQVPADEGSSDISAYDQECLFARIVASAMVTTIMEAEKKNVFSFARYAGGGLRDFTAPVENPPEPHIENISNHSRMIVPHIDRFIAKLTTFRHLIAEGDSTALQVQL